VEKVVSGKVGQWVATAIAVVAIMAGVTVLTGVAVVQQQLVRERFYNTSLVHNDVYGRVYSEVLTDPELTNTAERLLGDLHVSVVDPTEARIFTTNALHLVLPPSRLQVAVEQFLTAVLAYIRGDTAQLAGDVNVQAIIPDVQAAAVEYARSALAAARPETMSTLDSYRAAVGEFATRLTAGIIPSSIPVPVSTLPVAGITAALSVAVGSRVAAPIAELIEGSVSAGDARDALITAITPRVENVAHSAAAAVSRTLDRGGDFGVVGALARHADTTRAMVAASIDPARRAVSWFGPWTAVVGFALVFAGVGGLLFVHRGHWGRALALIAGALMAAGLAVNVLWFVARHSVNPPLHPATSTGPGTWNLPAGLRHVVRDVEGTLANELQRAVWRISLIPIVLGVAIAVALAVVRLRNERAVRIGVAAIAAAGTAAVVVNAFVPEASNARACDGHAELCDRPYDKVVQAATHNSMSSPDVVQIWPEQDLTIRQQLDLGVRTLLIDVHYWPAISSPEQLTRLEPSLPPEAARLIMSIAPDRFRAHAGLFLCHVLCALGGVPLSDGLSQVRSFLADNPNEIVTLIVEDDVARADLVRAFGDAGLVDNVYQHTARQPWPTLGDLIDHNQRLVVFAENSGPPPTWFQSAFDDIADTPFGFATASDMTCAENRGAPDASLFLINHWVSGPAPDRATALSVNQTDTVVARAQRCAQERRRSPTFIAVDFANLGDVVRAVDILNGVKS
jgi:hypothetical protein